VYICDYVGLGGGGREKNPSSKPLDKHSSSKPLDKHSNRSTLQARSYDRRCVCLLLQDLVQSCVRGEGGDIEGHVLRETGTREEPGTLIQGAPVFPGSSRLGIEPKTPGWLVQDPTTSPSGDLIPTIRGSRAHPGRGRCVWKRGSVHPKSLSDVCCVCCVYY
jgi:hypothetical protein